MSKYIVFFFFFLFVEVAEKESGSLGNYAHLATCKILFKRHYSGQGELLDQLSIHFNDVSST